MQIARRYVRHATDAPHVASYHQSQADIPEPAIGLRDSNGVVARLAAPKLRIAPMDEITARLESLLRFYAGAVSYDQGPGAVLARKLSTDLRLLVAEFGPKAVDAALDKISVGPWQACSLH
jgi:hypothetical protein